MTTETKKEQAEKVVDKDAIVQKRLYISGLKEDVAAAELGARFKSFGKVLSVDLAGGGPTGGCRGFGYVSIEATPASIGKCLSVYNGSKWKGMQLHIEEAKQSYLTKLKREWAQIAAHDEALRQSEGKPAPISNKKRKKRAVDLAPDMSLVTDRNAKNRKHWRLSRFGRAVSVFRYREPATGRMVTVDPLRYKDNITRPESYAKFTPVSKLQWPSDDIIAPKPRWQLLLEQAAAEEAEAKAAKAAREGGIFQESDNDEESAQYPTLDVTALYEDERDTETESEEDDDITAGGLFDEMDVDEVAPAPILKHVRLEYDDVPLASDDDDDFEVVPSAAPRIVMPTGFSDDSDDDVPSVVPPPRHTERDSQLTKERSHLLGVVQSILGDQREDSDGDMAQTQTVVFSGDVPVLKPVSLHHGDVKNEPPSDNAIPAPNTETADLLEHIETAVEHQPQAETLSKRAVASSQGSEQMDQSSQEDEDHEFASDSDSEGSENEVPSAGSVDDSEEDSETDETDEEEVVEQAKDTVGPISAECQQEADESDSENSAERTAAEQTSHHSSPPTALSMDGKRTSHVGSAHPMDADVEAKTSAADTVSNKNPSSAKPLRPVPQTGDRHYAVNTNLRALLFADSADDENRPGFSLFGERPESSATPAGVDLFARPPPPTSEPSFELFPSTRASASASREQSSPQAFDAADVARSFGSSQLFFLHIGDRSLAHRSIYAPDGTFKRTDTEYV
ncbi:nucleolar protein 8 [Geranomyces michiganensis]|nr:nucleolar protein 8 [Geranomyces michiganensis]